MFHFVCFYSVFFCILSSYFNNFVTKWGTWFHSLTILLIIMIIHRKLAREGTICASESCRCFPLQIGFPNYSLRSIFKYRYQGACLDHRFLPWMGAGLAFVGAEYFHSSSHTSGFSLDMTALPWAGDFVFCEYFFVLLLWVCIFKANGPAHSVASAFASNSWCKQSPSHQFRRWLKYETLLLNFLFQSDCRSCRYTSYL